jgi:hypothetical protein
MEYTTVRYILLYFPIDKSFDILLKTETSFKEECFEKLILEETTVKVKADYEGVMSTGIVVQVAESKDSLTPYLEQCVYLKGKGFSIGKIMGLEFIPRLNDGRRPKFPKRNVSCSIAF